MTKVEKIIEEIQQMSTPTAKFVDFILSQEVYKKAKTDSNRKKAIMEISERYSDVFKNGEYEDLMNQL